MQRDGPSHRGEIINKDDQVLVPVVSLSRVGLNVHVNKLKGMFSMHRSQGEEVLRLFSFSTVRTDTGNVIGNSEIWESGHMLLCLLNNLF